jgi:hypothetical protein
MLGLLWVCDKGSRRFSKAATGVKGKMNWGGELLGDPVGRPTTVERILRVAQKDICRPDPSTVILSVSEGSGV